MEIERAAVGAAILGWAAAISTWMTARTGSSPAAVSSGWLWWAVDLSSNQIRCWRGFLPSGGAKRAGEGLLEGPCRCSCGCWRLCGVAPFGSSQIRAQFGGTAGENRVDYGHDR